MTRTFSRVGSLRSFFLASLLVALAATICGTSCSAQETNPPPQAGIQATSEVVKIDVSVLDRHGEFVGGLNKTAFRVLDDGVERPIEVFTPVDAPAEVLVLIETSPAVYLIRAEHLTAAYALLDGLAADDEVALVSYSQAPQALLPFTADKREVAAALGQIQYTLGMGDLNFYDSVSTVLDWLAPLRGKKAIVALTTGLDSSPPARWDALEQKLKSDDAVIFGVALGGSLRQPAPKKKKGAMAAPNPVDAGEKPNPVSFAKADAALREMASITGGRVYVPQSPNEFVPIYREIAATLRHQYVLGIAPQHDGKFHNLTVEIPSAEGSAKSGPAQHAEYRIFARQGYLAPLR